jgi:hypothetical protein
MAKLDARLRAYILASLCEGMSQRSCQRIFGVEQNTVDKLLVDAGDMAITHLASLKGLKIRKIQADELHGFIGAKDFTLQRMENPPDVPGTVWGYLAMCCETKLIFSYFLGDRTTEDATFFFQDVAKKLKRKEEDKKGGEFEVRPHVATDGLAAYQEAFGQAFGDFADFGVLVKSYSKVDKNGNKRPGARFTGSVRERGSGNPVKADTHTSYIERQNLNLRMGNRRYTRKSNAFSKKHENHERHLALWIMYHNYCWVPRPVRPLDADGRPERGDDGKPKRWIKRLPAAMEAGLATGVWDVDELLALTDDFVKRRRQIERTAKQNAKAAEKAARAKAKIDALGETRAPFWVYKSIVHRTTKVHASACTNCNDGHGKGFKGNTKSGEWLPFGSYDDAVACAEAVSPYGHSICNMCLGSYHTLGHGNLRAGGGALRLSAG